MFVNLWTKTLTRPGGVWIKGPVGSSGFSSPQGYKGYTRMSKQKHFSEVYWKL